MNNKNAIEKEIPKDMEDAAIDVMAVAVASGQVHVEDGKAIWYIGDEYIDILKYMSVEDIKLAVISSMKYFRSVSAESEEELIESKMNKLLGGDVEALIDGGIIDEETALKYNEGIRRAKEILKGHAYACPEVVARAITETLDDTGFDQEDKEAMATLLIAGSKEYKEFIDNIKIHDRIYLLKLMNEGVIPKQSIIDSGFFETISLEEIINLYQEGLLPVDIIMESKSLKNIGGQIDANGLEALSNLGLFDNLDVMSLSKFRQNGFLTNKNVIELYNSGKINRDTLRDFFGGTQEVAALYQRAVKRKNKKEADLYLDLLDANAICTSYINGEVPLSDVEKAQIDKEFINSLSEEDFLKFAQRGFPKGVNFESDELIKGYITKYSGETLVALAKKGYIESEKLLELLDIEVEPEDRERAITKDELLTLYTPNVVAKLLKEGKISEEFIVKLNEKILADINDDEKIEYIKLLIEKCEKQLDQTKYTEEMIHLLEHGILPEQVWQELNFSKDAVENMLIEGVLTEEHAIEYFNKGILNGETIELIFGKEYDKIIDCIKDGTLSSRAYLNVPKKVIQDSLEIGMLEVSDVFDIYSKYDGFSSEELGDIFEAYGNAVDKRVKIVDLITKDFDPHKLKELFVFDVLTHSDILELKELGIITEKQSEEISEINREKLYREIFGEDTSIENIGEDKEGTGVNRDYREKNQEDQEEEHNKIMSPSERRKYFKALGRCDFKDVKGYDIEGRKAPFDGYELIGFPDYGIVVFENFDEPRNATYVMTLQELKSYITKGTEKEKSIIFRKSKQALIEEIENGRAVRRRKHTANWGDNLIEAMKELSKEAKEAISEEEQEKLAEWMREEYIKSRTDDPEAADLIRAKAVRDLAKEEQYGAIALEDTVKAAAKIDSQTLTK